MSIEGHDKKPDSLAVRHLALNGSGPKQANGDDKWCPTFCRPDDAIVLRTLDGHCCVASMDNLRKERYVHVHLPMARSTSV